MHEPLMSINDVADWLRLEVSTIRHLIFSRKIPYLKVGKSIRFCRDDLLYWLNKNKRMCNYNTITRDQSCWQTNQYNLSTDESK